MTLGEAVERFRQSIAPEKDPLCDSSIAALERYAAARPAIGFPSSAIVRDLLGRWYLEGAAGPAGTTASSAADLPELNTLAETLTRLIIWLDERSPVQAYPTLAPVIADLQQTVPIAIEISRVLSDEISGKGAFGFPEFLSSFESGGRSRYDLDEPGDVGSLDGHFRLSKIDGVLAELEDPMSGDSIWPVRFPPATAGLLRAGFTLDLEIVRQENEWRISGCGFAYPPGIDPAS